MEGQANDGNAWYYFGGISGHAGLFSNAAGVAELGRFYLNTAAALGIAGAELKAQSPAPRPFLQGTEEGGLLGVDGG